MTTPAASGPQPADANNLYLAYVQIGALIVTVTASPNPDYSENGRSIPKATYLGMLLDKQKTILQAIQMALGPYELRSVVRSR